MTLLTHPLLGRHPGDTCVLAASFYLHAGGSAPARGLHVEKTGWRPAGLRWGEVSRPASKVTQPWCQHALGRKLCLALNPPNTKQLTQRPEGHSSACFIPSLETLRWEWADCTIDLII